MADFLDVLLQGVSDSIWVFLNFSHKSVSNLQCNSERIIQIDHRSEQ